MGPEHGGTQELPWLRQQHREAYEHVKLCGWARRLFRFAMKCRLAASVLLLTAACMCGPLNCSAFPMDVARNAEMQQQKEQQLQQEQLRKQQEEALALLSLHEKYSPPNCKYHPLPASLNSFGFLHNSGELMINDVFGLPGISEYEEQVIGFFIPDSVEGGRSILSLSVDAHRDNFVEFKHLELYRHKRSEPPPVAFKHASTDVAAVAARRRNALQTATIIEGAGGTKTRAVLSASLADAERDSLFYIVIGISPSAGRSSLGPPDDASRHLLPCHALRVDLALVPYSRMQVHMPSSCPSSSFLPVVPPELTLDDGGLTFASSPEKPFVLNFAGQDTWPPFSRSVFQTAIRVPARLHRFVRFFMRISFRFISGPFQLMLELFEEDSPPDASASAPVCALGCLGGTPTFNGQLFDHAMPTGFIYKIWILAGDPMYFDDHSTQCMEFDFEYSVKFESRMTPFEVTAHSWMCPFARLPGLIVQLKQDTEDTIMSDELGVAKMHSIDLRDWFGFPPDELDSMSHTIRLILQQPSTLRVVALQEKLEIKLHVSDVSRPDQKICTPKDSPKSLLTSIHCQLPAGEYAVTFKASYPLGGIPPCDGFFARIAVRPISYLQQGFSCARNGELLPPLIFGELTPASAQTLPQTYLNLGSIKTSDEGEKFVPYLLEVPAPHTESSLHKVGGGAFEVTRGTHETFLQLAALVDYTALDLLAVVKREGSADPVHILAFAQKYQHFVGPLEPGRYELEILVLNAQTADPSKAEKHCTPLALDARLQRLQSGPPAQKKQWLCGRERSFIPKQMRQVAVTEEAHFLLDTKFGVPASAGHHFLTLSVPRRSLLKLSVTVPQGPAPHMVVYPEGQPENVLAEAYGDLFMEADSAGRYVIRFTFVPPRDSAGCPTARFHFVATPVSLVPVCPWARGAQQLTALELRQAAKAAFEVKFDASMLLPKQVGSDGVEVSWPHDIWLSPSLQPEFPFTAPGTSSSLRVEVALQPAWLPLRLELHRKDDMGIRRTAHAVSEYTEGRILLLTRDLPGGDYVLKFVVYDQAQLETERLCAHATINAELGENNSALLNAVRAELLEVPDLLPVEPPPKSLNTRGWLSNPDVPIFANSVFSFSTVEQQQRETRLIPATTGVARSSLRVSKPTVLRVAAEPAIASNAQLTLRIFPEGGMAASAAGSGTDIVALPLPTTGSIAEAKDNNLVTLLQPGSYLLAFEGTEPFLTTIGLMSIDALRSALPGPAGTPSAGPVCSASLPSIALPSPLPPTFESEDYFFSVDFSSVNAAGDLLSVPLHLASSAVVYAEVGSNFVVDFVRVGIEVVEGLWLGEQRGRQNSLKLLLDEGQHSLRVRLENDLADNKALRDAILNGAQASRCLHFSLHVSAHSLTSADARHGNPVEECSAFGAVPLPTDLNTANGGSGTLGGPLDKEGRIVLRSKAVLHSGAATQHRIAIDSQGKDLLLKVGTFLEDQSRSVSISLQDSLSQAVAALYDWTLGGGHHERIYRLQPSNAGSVFHLVLSGDGDGCLLFDLFIQSVPYSGLDQMSDCSTFGRPAVSTAEFFKPAVVGAAASLSSARPDNSASPQQVLSPLQPLLQGQDGFLKTIEFQVSEPSFVLAEVGFNFMVSHVEMDLVTPNSDHPIAIGELDFLHTVDHPINARQWIATHLDPGRFVLRVADDHFPLQFIHHAERCFPFHFFFHIHALNDRGLQPSVIALHPDPSVPIKSGQDLLLLLRLSEPPNMVEGSLDAKGAVHLRGESGVYVYPAAQVKLDTTEDDTASGGLVWSFFFPADALRSLGPRATLEVDMHTSNGSSFSLEWLNRLHEQRQVVLTIEGDTRVISSPWKGGALPLPPPLTAQQYKQQQLQLQQQQQQQRYPHTTPEPQNVGVVKAEQEAIIDPYRPNSEPGSVRPRSVMPPKAAPPELPEDEPIHEQQFYQEEHKETELRKAPIGEPHPHAPEHDVAVECAKGEVWDEEAEECRPIKSESTSLWLLLVVSVFGVGGVWIISRVIVKRRSGGGKALQRDTEFGRFDLLSMDERRFSDFDDDV
ncbi:hypothetical protein Esti_006130 [Eimeria stiedai]